MISPALTALAQSVLGAQAHALYAEQAAIETGHSRDEITATAEAMFVGADATDGA